MKTIHLTKAEFLDKVVNYEANPNEWKYLGDNRRSSTFTPRGAGPCKMVAPILDELAQEYDGKIYVYKVDTEKEQELAAAFGIRRFPRCCSCRWTASRRWCRGLSARTISKR